MQKPDIKASMVQKLVHSVGGSQDYGTKGEDAKKLKAETGDGGV
jgi:hypothetical protein